MVDWESISPEDFEKLCTFILYKNNFHDIKRMGGTGDRSRDIIAKKTRNYMSGIENDEVWIAQCKRYISRPPTIQELQKTIDWCKFHKPDGILFFITNKLPSATNDWIEEIKKEYKFEILILDIDYLENELMNDSILYQRFFEEEKTIEQPEVWYDWLTGPKTQEFIIYTAGEMPEEPDRDAIAEWREKLQNEVKLNGLNVGFFHPEFCGCDHGGISVGETVSMDTYMIKKSDALIAFLNNEELFGTITEIMIAYSQNKKISIFIDENIIHNIELPDTPEDISNEIKLQVMQKSLDKLYSEIYKTKHYCPCILYIDGDNTLVLSKYWFMLNFLKQSRRDIEIKVVNKDNYIEKMVSVIKSWTLSIK